MVIFLPLFWSESFKRAIEEADRVAEEADLDDLANPAVVVGEDEADLVGEVVDRRGCRSGRSNVGDEVADLDGELLDLRTERRGGDRDKK